MYDLETRREALRLMAGGDSVSAASRALGVSRAAIRAWASDPHGRRLNPCPRGTDVPAPEYAALLGYYLGDGCLSRSGRTYTLRVSCDRRYPGIIDDVSDLMSTVRGRGAAGRVPAPGCVVVVSYWNHWPCLFPQHGPGRKHERRLVLEPWQQEVLAAHPGPFLRGLFHSDGCRVANWATREVGGRTKRYDYARWQFVNHSEDILGWCTEALDCLDVPWRRSGRHTVSVSRRDGVARLDDVVGLKS